MSEEPWFKNGLRFECTQCGDCCTGAPGYVWVNREEIAALARRGRPVGRPTSRQQYVRQVGIRKSLIEYANGDCVFFDSHARKCTVYDARPRQCRTWPFWQSNVASEEAWNRRARFAPAAARASSTRPSRCCIRFRS